MNNLEKYNCFICRKPILGLKGQDLVLDSYLLTGSGEDKKILDNETFGSVHIKCLSEDAFAFNFWRTRLLEHYSAGSFYKYKDDILINNNSAEIMSFESIQIFSVRKIEIQSVDDAQNNIASEHEINVDLTSLGRNDLNQISEALKKRNLFPLIELIGKLKISDFIINSETLSDASIKAFVAEEEETFYALKEGFFSGICIYKIFVSDDFLSGLNTLG